MSLLKIVLIVLLTTGLHAKAAKWKDLKSVNLYTASDFHLKPSVKCLEIKTCITDTASKKCGGMPFTEVAICPKSLKYFDSKLINRFEKLFPKASIKDNIRKVILPNSIINGFTIDDKGSIWRMNEIEDIIDILGEIDTSAEVQLVLWLYGKHQGKRYKKVSDGYEVISENFRSICDGIDDYEEYSTYSLHVNREGKVTKEKRLKYNNHKVQLVKKPAIYLYPLKKQKIDISLAINGAIIVSIPSYEKGWSVMVDLNGTIENKYDYLFYENTLKTIELPKEGWIKQGSELEVWFSTILPKLGLNTKETKQFKEYWLEELHKNFLYEVKLFSLPFLSKNMTLTINPKPDTLIRVIFNFKVIKEPYMIDEPSIVTPKRSGFHVLEWGGRIEGKRQCP